MSSKKAKSLSSGLKRSCIASNEQCGHQGVPLLASLTLQNLMNHALTVLPQICGWRAIELQNEWQDGLSPLHVPQTTQHGIAGDGVVRRDSIHSEDSGLWILIGEDLKSMSYAFTPSPGG